MKENFICIGDIFLLLLLLLLLLLHLFNGLFFQDSLVKPAPER